MYFFCYKRAQERGKFLKILKRVLVFISALVAPIAVSAQSPLIYSWGPNQGLVQYSISSIEQDEHGYIWLGAESGASRFNGRDFETYDNQNGFVNEAVRAINVAGDDIFLLTQGGALFKVVPGGARRIDVGEKVLGLLKAPDGGDPWLITVSGLKRDIVGKTARLPFDISILELENPPNTIHNGELFVGVGSDVYRFGAEVERVAGVQGRIEGLFTIPGQDLGIVTRGGIYALDFSSSQTAVFWDSGDMVLTCGVSGHERIVLGTTMGAVVVFESGRFQVLKHGMPGQAVMTVLIDRENDIWVGLDSGGVLLLPVAAFTSYTAADGVGTGDAFYIVADSFRGGVWVGTRNGGIAHISDDGVLSLNHSNGLPSDRVRALHQASDGTLFVGTSAGIFAYELSGKSWVYHAPPDSYFQFFFEDHRGVVYCGSQSGRLVAWHGGRTFRTINTSVLPDHLSMTSMNELGETMYLGTSHGVYVGHPETGVFRGPFAGGGLVREIVIDGQHEAWVATADQGAWRYSHGSWKNFGPNQGFDLQVRFVITDKAGNPWFGGNGGVWSFIDDEVSRINTSNGLRSDNIFLIRFDPMGQLWVGHNNGLDLIRGGKVVSRFDNRDGLADNELNANGFAVDEKGRLWFCTMRGVSWIDPAALTRQRVNPLIHLRGLEVNDRPLQVQHTSEGLAPVRLRHDENSLRFHFSGQSFIEPNAIRYTYRLDGVDDNWTRPVAVGWALYPKLPPGRYTFRVRCSSSDGLESPVASIDVEIVPALWQRLSFRLLCGLAILGAVFGALIMRNHRIVARNLELERLVEERTRDLEVANNELRRLAITDPLTGLFNRRFFEEEIQSELASALRSFRNATTHQRRSQNNSHLAIFMMDLDHFKEINDRYGHDAGDQVLRDFARVVRDVIRTSDTLFRWGGEEFLLLARNTDSASTEILAERIRVAVAAHRSNCEGETIAVTCSIGFVPFPFVTATPGTVGWSELVHIADQALYLAKSWGRNAWVGVKMTSLLAEMEQFETVMNNLQDACEMGLVDLESNLHPRDFEQ